MSSAASSYLALMAGGPTPDLLNLNLLDPAQYEPGGWLYENHSRASTATRRNSSGLIESVAIDVPRLQHDVNGNPLYYLSEPSATRINPEAHPDELSTASGAGTFTVTAGEPNPVTGNDDGVLVQATDATYARLFYYAGGGLTGKTITSSIYVWQDTPGRFGISHYMGSGSSIDGDVFVDLSDDSIISQGADIDNVEIEDCGNGVKRVIITGDFLAAGSDYVRIYPLGYYGGSLRSGSCKLWHLQVEEGTVATSPILGEGAPVTRAADATDFSIAEGRDVTIFMALRNFDREDGGSFLWRANGHSTYIRINTSNTDGWNLYVDGTPSSFNGPGSSDPDDRLGIAVRLAADGDCRIISETEGGTSPAGTDHSKTPDLDLTSCSLGANGANAGYEAFRVVGRKMNDDEMNPALLQLLNG